jgi:hypothetical protein
MDSLKKNPSLGNKTKFEPGAFEIHGTSKGGMQFRPLHTLISVSTRAYELLKI